MEKITALYTAEVINTGGRKGHVKSTDGILDMDVSMPVSMGGHGGKTNPEQLFAAGYASCFNGAVGAVAQGRNITDAALTAKVSIGKDSAGFGLSVELHGNFPNLSKEEAIKLMEDAHQACPYSKATRGNIEVLLSAN
ncbi:MAG: organic hydroperoxide resistance protein [Arcicella sp.]|nr:organic hydroperoxide resistance protein [Arcicella sp.]